MICVEMLLASAAMLFAFPHNEYKMGGATSGLRVGAMLHAISIKDVINDTVHVVSAPPSADANPAQPPQHGHKQHDSKIVGRSHACAWQQRRAKKDAGKLIVSWPPTSHASLPAAACSLRPPTTTMCCIAMVALLRMSSGKPEI
jgi:hypothetical protein